MTILDDNVAALTTQVNALIAAVNVSKAALDTAVTNAQNSANAASLSASSATSGIQVATATASVALSANQLVYLLSNGQLALADASVEGKEAIGFVKQAYAASATATYFTFGALMSGLSALTVNAAYYMLTTPGAFGLIAAAPQLGSTGNVLLKIGKAISATQILFTPETPITL